MIPEQFRQFERGNEILVTPGGSVGNDWWKDWRHRWLRSMHIRSDDRSIISCGFPKFMELGEGAGEYLIDEDGLRARAGKDMWATRKIDGSLLVRFVQEGRVRIRTRGFLGIKDADDTDEIRSLLAACPAMLDPLVCPESSILLEWVSPRHRVVLRHDEASATLVGGVSYVKDTPWHRANPRLFTQKELVELSGTSGVPYVAFSQLQDADAVNDLIGSLKGNLETEGFVVRFDGGQRMSKIKTRNYQLLHALNISLSSTGLVGLWLEWGKPIFMAYNTRFLNFFDNEYWREAMPAVSSMYGGIAVAQSVIGHMADFIDANKHLDPEQLTSKANSRFPENRLPIYFALSEGRAVPDDIWKKLILQNCKQI